MIMIQYLTLIERKSYVTAVKASRVTGGGGGRGVNIIIPAQIQKQPPTFFINPPIAYPGVMYIVQWELCALVLLHFN